MSIKNRIYISFFIMVFLFVIYCVVNIVASTRSTKLSKTISEVIDPSVQATFDLKQLLTESKMYGSNWVFLKNKKEDKEELLVLHKSRYPELKARLSTLFTRLPGRSEADNMNKEFAGFEELMGVEKQIMSTLANDDDYNDSLKRLTCQSLVENEVLPMTDELITTLDGIIFRVQNIKSVAQNKLEESSSLFRTLILSLMVTVILLGMLLSNYLTAIITKPIRKMNRILNGIGKGILEKVNWKEDDDEIGQMVKAVNNVSRKLKVAAQFAEEIGERNFQSQFEPLSDKDVLGRSLITMRNNLKETDENLNEAQHIAKIGNWECDMELRFKWSYEMYSILDYDPLTTKPGYKEFVKSICAEDTSKLLSLLTECLEQGTSFSFDCKIITVKKNTKVVTIQAKLLQVPGKNGNKIIGIMQDITRQKRVEEELVQNNEELTKSNMELDKFVYSVSHDLRAPLSSMSGVIDLSLDETQEPLIVKHFEMLKGSVNKLDSFISDILDYSRNTRLEVKREEINFKEMLEDVTANLKYMGTGNRKVDIKMDVSNQKPFYSSKSRIGVVLNNLISNAIRYQNPEVENPLVDIKIDVSDTETNIIVRDNGIGIKKENHQKIFEMFYRISEKSVGSGLGLYIVKEIVDKLDGRIEVESEPGKGTAFSIYLPNLFSSVN